MSDGTGALVVVKNPETKVDLLKLDSTQQLRDYKKSVIAPQGVEFNKRQIDHQLFPEEYFTGTDVYVYFNDIWNDQITGLSFTLSEKVAAIHGYASNTWDHVSRGKRIVQGQFRIAFKEAGYMFAILDHIGKLGNTKKTALSWLLNTDAEEEGIDGVPDGYADVLERIEDSLQRLHGDPNAKVKGTSYEEQVVMDYDWQLPLQLGSPNTRMPNARTSTKQWGQISQLQQRLIDIGEGWPAANFGWNKRYGGDTWTTNDGEVVSASPPSAVFDYIKKYTGKALSTRSGDWYVCIRYYPDSADGRMHASIGGKNAKSNFEVQLQQRLDQYPSEGLFGLWMGSPDGVTRYDGKFGSGPLAGLRKFQELAGINDGSKGYYVSTETKKALEAGLAVTGRYDIATRIAVWLFQEKQIRDGNPYNIKRANGIVDTETMKALAETVTKKVITPGENRYKPGETSESLFTTYEKEVWGRPFEARAEDVRRQDSFFYRSRRSDTGQVNMEPLWQDGFDIYINYGPLPQFVQNQLNQLPDAVNFNTTVKAIRNVQLTDVQQVMDSNTGQPIEEIYTFIAKDLD